MVEFTVPGEPRGKERPRFDSRHRRTYTPEPTKLYEEEIKWCYRLKCMYMVPKGVPVELGIDAYYKIPESANKKAKAAMLIGEIKPTKKPDTDNIIKCVADALNGVAYHDDAQIVKAVCSKHYAKEPHIRVRVGEYTGGPDHE